MNLRRFKGHSRQKNVFTKNKWKYLLCYKQQQQVNVFQEHCIHEEYEKTSCLTEIGRECKLFVYLFLLIHILHCEGTHLRNSGGTERGPTN